MLSQKIDKSGKTLLDQNVHRIAEVLVITQTNRLPNREQLLQLVECYENESMTNIMRKDMMQKLSEGIFQESPIQKDKLMSKPTPRSRSAVQMKGSDSDSDLDQDEQEVQTRSMSDDDFQARMNYHVYQYNPRCKTRCVRKNCWRSIYRILENLRWLTLLPWYCML